MIFFRLGGDEERPIYALGDGFQALIAITFPLFVARSRALFFIEELDSHLHPGMQRKLLEVFLRSERIRHHQIFATTHSNHFLDMAADYNGCTTILVRRPVADEKSFTIIPIGQKQREVFDDLGVRASSMFLTNATIWVEGISDRLYLREYLRRCLARSEALASLHEDTHYSFMEGGGANIAHFDFDSASAVAELGERIKVARICSNSCLVLDGDNEGKPRLDILRGDLGPDLILTEGKEIEHLLPLEALRAYVSSRLPDVDLTLLSAEHYQGVRRPLGEILDDVLGTDIFTDGQTVKGKAGLLDFSLAWLRSNESSWELTADGQRICEQIVAFIRRANGIAS